jgi:YVTN family beta-propeller protein
VLTDNLYEKNPLMTSPSGPCMSIARRGVVFLIAWLFLFSIRSASAALGSLVETFNMQASRMALDPVRPRIYATLTGSNAVAVIDTSTMKVVQIIPIGSNPLGLAVSADGSRLYVANTGSTTNGVGVIDLTTLQTLPSLPTPEPPSDVAVGLNGQLYLTVAANDIEVGSIMQISTSGTVQAQYFGSDYNEGEAFLAISPDKKTLYYGDAGLSPATLDSYDVSGTIGTASQAAPFDSVGSNGEDLEISHSGAFLCFAVGSGQGNYGIAEIPASNISASNGLFDEEAYPANVAFSPDDAYVYSAGEDQGTMRVFDSATFVQTASFPIAGDMNRLITDSSGRYLFAAGANDFISDDPNLYVYDTGRAAAAITSSTSQVAAVGVAFSYQITATNGPTSYNATGLPPGLSVDTVHGVISGTATTTGSSQVIISASNAIGVAMATLDLNVEYQLTVTASSGGAVTKGFLGTTYYDSGANLAITATPSPGYYFAGWSGDITSNSDPLSFTLQGDTAIQANFALAAPVVTSGTVSGDYGSAFKYQIGVFGVGPYQYSADLPSGLSVDSSTGLITGTLEQAGDLYISLSATNGGGGGAGTLTIDSDARLTVAAGSGGFVTHAGVSYLALGAAYQTTAFPGTGYAFKDWSGDSSSYSPTLSGTMQPSLGFTANFIPWSTCDGPYFGILSNNFGYLSFNVNGTGGFAGNLSVSGSTFHFAGLFPSDKLSTVTIHRGNLPSISITLNLDLTGAMPLISGSVSDGAMTEGAFSSLTAPYSVKNPCPQAGIYTVALGSSTDPGIPAGTGFGRMIISKAGMARLAGTLPDGRPFSFASPVAADSSVPVFNLLYGNKGYIAGGLMLESVSSTGIVDGSCAWLKPVTASGGLFPAAFSTTLTLVGSSYNHLQYLVGSGGSLAFADGNLSAPFSQAFTFNAAHAIVITGPNPHSVRCILSQLTGEFTGSFVDGVKTRHFQGVILQQQNSGEGLFVDSIGSGTVELTVVP